LGLLYPASTLAVGRGHFGRVVRIEAHHDDVEIIAQRVRHAVDPLLKALEHQRADQRAVVIDERQHHGLAGLEVLAQLDGLARPVDDRRRQRNLLAQPGDQIDTLELGRSSLG